MLNEKGQTEPIGSMVGSANNNHLKYEALERLWNNYINRLEPPTDGMVARFLYEAGRIFDKKPNMKAETRAPSDH